MVAFILLLERAHICSLVHHNLTLKYNMNWKDFPSTMARNSSTRIRKETNPFHVNPFLRLIHCEQPLLM